jgi:preprotein translocase subunit YajC
MFNAFLAEVAVPPPAPTTNDAMLQLITLVLLFAGMYFLVVVPANTRQKQRQKLLSELKKGDEVVTNGGIYGKIVSIKDSRARLLIAKDVEVEIDVAAISARADKGE